MGSCQAREITSNKFHTKASNHKIRNLIYQVMIRNWKIGIGVNKFLTKKLRTTLEDAHVKP